MREALVVSRSTARARRSARSRRRSHRAVVQGVERADLVVVYRELSRRCDYPLHLGLTEAGMGTRHRRATAAMAVLLQEASATRSACRSRPSPTAIARRKSSSRRRSCRRWGCARSRRWSRRVPAAAAPQHVLPVARVAHPVVPAHVDAHVAHAVSWRGDDARRCDGLRRQRSRRIEARQRRHLAPRHRRGAVAPVYVDGQRQ